MLTTIYYNMVLYCLDSHSAYAKVIFKMKKVPKVIHYKWTVVCKDTTVVGQLSIVVHTCEDKLFASMCVISSRWTMYCVQIILSTSIHDVSCLCTCITASAMYAHV